MCRSHASPITDFMIAAQSGCRGGETGVRQSPSPPQLFWVVIEPLLDQLIVPPCLPRDLLQRPRDAFGIGEAELPARGDMIAFDQARPDSHRLDLLEGRQHATLLGR